MPTARPARVSLSTVLFYEGVGDLVQESENGLVVSGCVSFPPQGNK
jgi:hypothetical protein